MSLKDEMKEITDEANRTKKEKEEIKRKQATIQARESGQKAANRIIKDLPKRIEKTAKEGKISVFESCCAGSEYGSYMFSYIGDWAKEQGFKIKYKYNREAANEGGDPWDSLTISWEK